ncbi:nucleotidyltransferase family protein [Belliella sp. DSM 111904]|uniref:Nucleotidyltransferase family protein n=1 Tax=Belliella filtrata TaxID=2923435 RepID=A0ABS9V4D1_9BACT|nr:nucleotidyltransferase family protein [Belliella filtrata]MCH7411256.1 nucleotidyltransferase family protein [Belliella filtrata]
MNDENFKKTAILILAAGNSSRLGRPKQLLKIKGDTLLETSLKVAKKSNASHIAVVLGANQEKIQSQVNFSGVDVIVNKSWPEGMTCSIQAGLNHLIDKYHINLVTIMLCDQPFVYSELLNNLLNIKAKNIGACSYNNTIGVPVSFSERYFKSIMELKSSEGAKKIILQHLHDCEIFNFDQGSIDIDTQDDYEEFIKSLDA